jgi:murein DD-endopeptidase MepM/ murein hydrolase activator NlpD
VPAAATTRAGLTRRCLAGAFAIVEPGAVPLVAGPFARRAGARAGRAGPFGYPGAAPVVSARSASAVACSGAVRLASLSLFGGAVTAASAELSTSGASVTGLHAAVGTWGRVVQDQTTTAGGVETRAALAVHLVRAHGGLPAGTVVLAAFATTATPPPAHPTRKQTRPAGAAKAKRTSGHARHEQRKHRKKRKKNAAHEPLRVTPKLGVRRLVFPVVGQADFGDSYGGFRGDVPGNWHHGDDIFAPLGTPVVAVADGTLNRVGWERIGGWRLWVRDNAGDEFYYAHLSGYSPAALHSDVVHAGEVIGFIGNTGDAFTTPPHLHFEVHPRPLLHLGYDGAVDPTTYLSAWPRLPHVHDPIPVHPPFPQGSVRSEAKLVFRELLDAHHLLPHRHSAPKLRRAGPSPKARPLPQLRPGVRRAAAAAAPHAGSGTDTAVLVAVAALAAAAAGGGGFWLYRRRVHLVELPPSRDA